MSPIQTSTNIAQAIIIKKMFKCAIAITSPNPGWEHNLFQNMSHRQTVDLFLFPNILKRSSVQPLIVFQIPHGGYRIDRRAYGQIQLT